MVGALKHFSDELSIQSLEDLAELQELDGLPVSAMTIEQAALMVLTCWPETL